MHLYYAYWCQGFILKFRHRQATSDAPLKGTNQTRQEQELEWQWIQTTMSLDVTSCHLMLLVIWFWLNMCPVPKSCFMMFLCKVDGSFTFWWVPQRCFAWQRPASVLHDAFQAWQKWCGSAATHAQLEALSGRQNLFRIMMLVCKQISSELRSCKRWFSHPLPLGWANSFCISFLSFMSITLYSSTENGPCPLRKITVLGAFPRYFKDMCAPQYTINLCPPALLSALRRCLFRISRVEEKVFDCFSLLTLAARIFFCLFGFLDHKLEP